MQNLFSIPFRSRVMDDFRNVTSMEPEMLCQRFVELYKIYKLDISRYLATGVYLILKYNDTVQYFYHKYSNSMEFLIYGTWQFAYNIHLTKKKLKCVHNALMAQQRQNFLA